MKYCKSNLFSIFLIIVATVIIITISGLIFRAVNQSDVYEGFSNSKTPNWVIAGYINGGSTPATGYSMDGVNWITASLAGVNPNSINCVACNDDASLWLMGTNNGLVSSTDGINWSPNNNSTLNTVNDIFWSKDKSMWVNVGYIKQQATNLTQAAIEYSTNGTSWKQCANLFGAGSGSLFTGIAYNNTVNGGTWVAGGLQNLENPLVAYSTDGINWYNSSSAAILNTGGPQSVISFGNNGFAAVGAMNPPIIISNDGNNNWRDGNSLSGVMYNPSDAVYTNNMIILAGNGINCIAYSSNNGTSFTGAVNSNNNNNELNDIASSGSNIIAVGYSRNISVTPVVQSGLIVT